MITQLEEEKTIILSILRKTMSVKVILQNSLKINNAGFDKKLEVELQKLRVKFDQISSQMAINRNTVTQFCLSQAQKKKIQPFIIHEPNVYKIQKMPHPQSTKGAQSYLIKQVSNKINQLEYAYLKAKDHLYIFNHAFIPQDFGQVNITFVLSYFRIQCVVGYVQLCIYFNRLIRCIMPISLQKKVCKILAIFFGKSVFELIDNQIILLFPEENAGSFDLQNSYLIFSKNLWIYESFNTYIVIQGSKYVIKGPGITETEAIYTAWRKNIIEQAQYCRLIDKTISQNTIWGEATSDRFIVSQNKCIHYQHLGAVYFSRFSRCQVFSSISQQIIKQVYHCGEIVQYSKGQIVYKESSILDKFYVVLSGQAQVIFQNDGLKQGYPQYIHVSQCFSIYSIYQQMPRIKLTLRVSSDSAVVYSIPIWKLKFLLGYNTEQIRQIQSCTIEKQFEEKLPKIGISDWMKRIIKLDVAESQKLSESTTKLIGTGKLKISKQLWMKLCEQNLYYLYQTVQESKKEQIE